MILTIHYALGFVVLATALAALFLAPARRYILYVLILQILVGAIVWWRLGPPPAAHWILAVLSGGIYAMANAFERRGRPPGLILAVLALGFVVFAVIFYLGMNAVHA